MSENTCAIRAEDYDILERSANIPTGADFALVLSDDCMEPFFKKGESVYVDARAELKEFEAGLFLYDGRVLCRQWCMDNNGAVHLLCANPAREAENITVERGKKLSVLGRIIADKKLPRPYYC